MERPAPAAAIATAMRVGARALQRGVAPCHRAQRDHLQRSHQCVRKGPAAPAGLTALTRMYRVYELGSGRVISTSCIKGRVVSRSCGKASPRRRHCNNHARRDARSAARRSAMPSCPTCSPTAQPPVRAKRAAALAGHTALTTMYRVYELGSDLLGAKRASSASRPYISYERRSAL